MFPSERPLTCIVCEEKVSRQFHTFTYLYLKLSKNLHSKCVYDLLGSLTFFLIKNVIYMAINPPFSSGLATPTYSTDCFFFAPPYVALATALNFQMCKNSLNMMLNVQLFRMRPITVILVHWFKTSLAAPVSDRNTVHWRGIGILPTYNRWRIQGNFGPLVPQRPKVACLPPPPPTVDRCEFFFYSFRCFLQI